ncbi:uncharacterized protein LOC134683586 [Mytilus trossulus]|uniref:uncharacterized protein LOC134683586 n=1 Tax=Mytilus trossulus TaxID=6551 RepID=UPI00300632F3
MLRQMVFSNFIQFKDFQSLSFKDGPHFFIGANSSGKSSTLEILRRCMSTDINSTMSSSYDETKNAYAFCKFEIPRCTNLEIFKNISTIWSGVVKRTNKTFLKIVWLRNSMLSTSTLVQVVDYIIDENGEFTVKRQKVVNADQSIGEEQLSRTMNKLVSITPQRDQTNSQLNTQKDDHLELALDLVDKMSLITDEELQANWTSNIDDFKMKLEDMQFIKKLESTYVATMPMRAIGTLQWTRSTKIDKKEKNYQEACERAEIINELRTSDDVDQPEAERIFKFLTDPFEYEFFTDPQKPGLMLVKETNTAEFPLLKTPEGVFEAKQFSLLMAHKVFHTICLEEPDRCMHPQMVERMRDIFQRESLHKNKMVIVVSHNPFLINSITAEKTHVFFRKVEQMSSKVSCDIRAIDDINRHITDVDNLKKLIFAAKVLCLEGKTDKIIIEGLFEHHFKYSDDDDNIRRDIHSHQLVVLGSKTFDSEVEKFCEQTSLPAKWIFDRDKYITLDKTKKKIAKIDTKIDPKGNYSQFKDNTIEEFLQDQNGFQKLSKELYNKGLFLWKSGDLEDTIIYSLNSAQQKEILSMTAPDLTGKTPEEALKATETFKEKIKRRISHIDRDKLRVLITYMSQSSEVKRFFDFLRRR